jgi:5'-nucleotidase/UDP-sugar diphosphatase
LARRATFINQVRSESSNVLVVDAGNAITASQGVVMSTEGKVMVEAMNRLGYDAMTLGDQDFQWGAATLKERMSEAQFPFLSANVYVGGTQQLFAQPYVLKEMAGHQVAIIGVTSRNLVNFVPSGSPDPVLAGEPIESVRGVVDSLNGKADVIIVSSNLGIDLDEQLAAAVPGIDVIVGGNPGTLMPEPYRDPTNGTVITQAGYQGEWVGKLTLQIDGSGKVTSAQSETVTLTADYADDPEMAGWLNTQQP